MQRHRKGWKNWRRAVVSLGMLAFSACQPETHQISLNPETAASGDTHCPTIQHQMGTTEVCGKPQTIVVLGSAVLEPLLALGVQPAAYGDYVLQPSDQYDDPSRQIPYLGQQITRPIANVGLATSPSIEAIVNVQPDLILGTEYSAAQYDALSQVAPTVLLEWNDAEANLRTIAQIVGRSEAAEQQLDEIEQQIAAVRDALAPVVANHPKVLLLRSGNLQDIAVGNKAFGQCSALLQDLGFQLLSPPELTEFEQNTPTTISLETLPKLNEADIILLLGTNFGQPKELTGTEAFEDHQLSNLKQNWQENAITQSLDASQDGRVYFMPYYLCIGLPGPIGTELYLEELQEQLLSSDGRTA